MLRQAPDAGDLLPERERAALLRSGYGEVRVVSCYEAGRDGFWVHRAPIASIQQNRRKRRAKG